MWRQTHVAETTWRVECITIAQKLRQIYLRFVIIEYVSVSRKLPYEEKIVFLGKCFTSTSRFKLDSSNSFLLEEA